MKSIRMPRAKAPRRALLAAAAGIAAVAATLAIALPGSASRTAPGTAATSPAKPTIVLVHGAWADRSSWDGVVTRLQQLGYTVDVPPNPLRSLSGDAAYIADFLSTIKGPIVLAGHSYGGAVISNAATGNSQVKALVYDDAYVPAQGETLLQLTTAQPGSCLAAADPTTVFNLVPYPGAPSGDADLYVKPSVFPGCFANGLPASQAAKLAATQRPLAASVLKEASGTPAWTSIPSWDVVGTADHVIVPAEQRFMAKRAHAHITEINAPHLSMISDPGVVTGVIVQAAHATG